MTATGYSLHSPEISGGDWFDPFDNAAVKMSAPVISLKVQQSGWLNIVNIQINISLFREVSKDELSDFLVVEIQRVYMSLDFSVLYNMLLR